MMNNGEKKKGFPPEAQNYCAEIHSEQTEYNKFTMWIVA